MFDRIAGVYDAMNLVICAFQEPRWRRAAVRARARAGRRAIDVASGTGKVAADLLARPAGRSGAGRRHLPGMIDVARARFARPRRDSRSSSATPWPCRRRTHVRRRDDRLRDAQPARLRARFRRDGALRPARRPRAVPRDRPAAQPARPVHALVVRPDRPPDRPGRRPGRRLRATSCAASRPTRRPSGSPRSCARPASSMSTGGGSPAGS